MNSKIGLLTAALGLSALLLVIWQNSQSRATLQPAENSPQVIAQTEQESLRSGSNGNIAQAPHYELAPELEFSGQDFKLYKGIKDVLDNLILSAQSTDKAQILTVASQWCEQQDLSTSGCQSFTAFFSRYLDYKLALASHESGDASANDSLLQIQQRLQALNDLRYQWFSEEEIAALFSDDQQLNEQALARRQIAMDKDLSREEKIQLIAEQLEQLPDEQRAPLEPTLQMHSLERIKSEYSDKQLRLIEVETRFGFEAAQRLEKTWHKQEAFQNKIHAIAQQYLALQSDDALALQKQQVAFLQQHFSGNELRRAKAILKGY